jgi:hypothetical protein
MQIKKPQALTPAVFYLVLLSIVAEIMQFL